ncbi:hypothetical protein JZ751_029208 [Albula glossodonta]|uniref:Uncharacterized protein n=1 Tax=Albula glossodonta TaxID=121402 RepID=A0A8T2PCE6_9TELE|nr:hypothetical protein JZ751_029208 [Albula glossodonta]
MPGVFFRVLTWFVFACCARSYGQKGVSWQYYAAVDQFYELKCDIDSRVLAGNATLTWRRDNNQTLENSSRRINIQNDSLLFLPVQLSDMGHYTCRYSSYEASVPMHKEKKMFLSVVRGMCPDQSDKKLIQIGTNDKLLCGLEHISALDQRAEISWLKDCNPIHFKTDFIRIKNMSTSAEGNYTCLMKFTYEGKNFSASRTILLTANDEQALLHPKVNYPQNETIKVKPGAEVMIRCTAFLGRNMDVADESIVHWIFNKSIIKENHYHEESDELEERDTGIYTVSRLVISEVRPEFFHVPLHCVVHNARGKDKGVVRLVPADDRNLYIHLLFCLAVPMGVIMVMMHHRFKVDVVLAYRKLRPVTTSKKDADGKLYDAYVSSLHDEELCSSWLQNFCLQVLPDVLEHRHGYKLFIHGRDDLPGEAAHDVIADAVRKSRRLIIIVSSLSQSDPDSVDLGLQSLKHDQPGFEQQIGLYDALVNNSLRVILVETGKDIDYSLFPESVRYLRRKQGALRYRQGIADPMAPPNSRFWKCLRYHMPPGSHVGPRKGSGIRTLCI